MSETAGKGPGAIPGKESEEGRRTLCVSFTHS